jgi:hypothetical protein
LLQRHCAGQACATCGLSNLSICEHKHLTALCPLPQAAAAAAPPQQTGEPGHYYRLRLLYRIAVLRAEPREAARTWRNLRRSSWTDWDRLQAIEQQQQQPTAAYSGAWGVIAAPASSPLRLRFVIRLAACPSASTSPSSTTPCVQRDSHPTNLGRIRACIYHAALHDRSDRCALLCSALPCTAATALAPPCARSQLSSTRVRRRRQQREAQTACVCPRAYTTLTLAATAPGRVQRHWRVKSATQGTAENGYLKAVVRHRQPGKGATGWDAGSLVCNNLHVQWILVQSTQQH